MTLYDRMRGVSERLIDRFDQGGASAILTVVVQNPDPLLPPAVQARQQQFKAVARGVTQRMIDATPNVSAGDIQVITDRRFTPQEGKRVLLNGINRLIVSVEPIPASGDPVAFRFYVR